MHLKEKTKLKKDAIDTQHLFAEIQCRRKKSVMQYLERSQINMTNILSFEITHFPGSLADKNDGLMRTGNKAELQSVFKAEVNPKEWPLKLPSSEYQTL